MNKAFLGIALAAHELWLRDDERGNRFVAPYGSNLSDSDLRYSNLSGSNLSGSNLSGSNLSSSNLSGSNLRYSNLRGSNLSSSNLSGSNLRYSNLSGSDLRYSNLSDSDLSDSNLSDSDLSDSNLSGSNLSGSNLSGSDLSGSNRVIGPQRSDGYLFTYCMGSQVVLAGCRRMAINDYIEHCETYADAAKKRETLAILECLRLLVEARKDEAA